MNAAHALSPPVPHSAARIAAWSGALSLHLAALGLLLMPVMPPPMLPRDANVCIAGPSKANVLSMPRSSCQPGA